MSTKYSNGNKEYELKGDFIIQVKICGINCIVEAFEEEKGLHYRTLGLKDLCGDEVEFHLSLDPSEVVRLLNHICNKVKDGFKLVDNDINSELTGAKVKVLHRNARYSYEENEKCFRIVFSDENFKLPDEDRCNREYINQYE